MGKRGRGSQIEGDTWPREVFGPCRGKKRHEEENRERERIAREKTALWLPSPPPAKFDDSENGNEDNNKGDSHGKKDGEIEREGSCRVTVALPRSLDNSLAT